MTREEREEQIRDYAPSSRTSPIVDELAAILSGHSEPYRTIAEAIVLGGAPEQTLKWLKAAVHFDIKLDRHDPEPFKAHVCD